MVKVVRQNNFLAVVAEREWAAIRAARQLKCSWSSWEGLPEQSKLWEYVRATKVNKDDVTSNVGSAEQALQQADKRISATYDSAIHSHASMGRRYCKRAHHPSGPVLQALLLDRCRWEALLPESSPEGP